MLEKHLEESLHDSRVLGVIKSLSRRSGSGVSCVFDSSYKRILVRFLGLLQCFFGCTFAPRACSEGLPFPTYRTHDCVVLDRMFIDRMVSSMYSTSDLPAGSGTMLGVDSLADSADLGRGRSSSMPFEGHGCPPLSGLNKCTCMHPLRGRT